MLILKNTSSKVQVITDAAVSTDVHASYVDFDGTTFAADSKNSAIVTGATTDVVDPPAGLNKRNVKLLMITNKHATTSVGVTVQVPDGTTTVQLFPKVTLLAGESLAYVEGDGFKVYGADGLPKTSTGLVRLYKLQNDQSNSTTTPTELTGITVACEVGTWMFRYMILYQSSVTTTGVKYSVNHTGTVTSFVANWHVVDNTATAATAAADQDAVAATAQVYSAFAARAKSTAGWGTTISVDTQNADMLAVVEGLMVVTVAGNIALYHGSETAAATTTKAGTSLMLCKTSS